MLGFALLILNYNYRLFSSKENVNMSESELNLMIPVCAYILHHHYFLKNLQIFLTTFHPELIILLIFF